MKLTNVFLFLAICAATATGCRKEDKINLSDLDNISGLGGDTWAPNAVDKWIADSLTTPWNISVKYKWDQGELEADLSRVLVPPYQSQVIPVMSSINRAWINVYVAEAGNTFGKVLFPKWFVLVGSPAYLNGAIKLGTAEGGNKVTLYDINNFRIKGMPGFVPSDTNAVIRMFQTIHHEFAHILDQNIAKPISFSASSARVYTTDWLNLTASESHNEGFVSTYAQSSKDDDWAETLSFMLVFGKTWFELYVNSINYTGTTASGTTAAEARQRLRDKETAIVTYFKQNYALDFYALQARSRSSIVSLLY